MNLIDYFDPANSKHLEWYNQIGVSEDNKWSKEALEAFEIHGVVPGPVFQEGIFIMAKIANYYMKKTLGETFVCPPGLVGKI